MVELTNISGDEEIIRTAMTSNGYEISHESADSVEIWLLTHQKYEHFEMASVIHEDAESLVARLSEIAALEGIEINIFVGSVLRVNADGTTNKHHFATFSSHIRLEAHAQTHVTYNPIITVDERLRRIAEAEERKTARERAALISRVARAIADPTLIQIIRLVRASNLTMTEAGHIVDIVHDALEGELGALTTKDELSRFRRSINHPKVMGLSARHAVTNVDPPPKPMTENEARSYAKRIGREWLRLHEGNT